MGKVFNMVGGGSSSFSATINVTNATPNETITVTLNGTSIIYTTTASSVGNASIVVDYLGNYILTCTNKYSTNAIILISGETYLVRMLDVPQEYQEVEFIQTTGSQYVAIGLTPDNSTETLADIIISSTKEDNNAFSAGTTTAHYHITAYRSKWYYGISGVESNGGSYSYVIGTRISIDYNNTDGKIYVDGVAISGSGTYSANSQFFVSYRVDGTNYGQFKYTLIRIRNKSNGDYLRYLIPCYKKSDNSAGLWDKVTNTFYAGSGALIVGGNIV